MSKITLTSSNPQKKLEDAKVCALQRQKTRETCQTSQNQPKCCRKFSTASSNTSCCLHKVVFTKGILSFFTFRFICSVPWHLVFGLHAWSRSFKYQNMKHVSQRLRREKTQFQRCFEMSGTWEYGWIRQRRMCVIQPLDVESLGVTCHYCHIRSCGRRRNAARPARHLQSPPCHRRLESANVQVLRVLRWGLFEIEQKWQQRSKVPRLIFCQFGDTNNSLLNMPSTVQSPRCYPFSPLWSATSTNAEQHSSWPNFQKKNQSQSDSFRSQIKVKGWKGQNCFMISCWPQFLAEPFQPAHCVVFQTTPESSHAVHWAEKGELCQSV